MTAQQMFCLWSSTLLYLFFTSNSAVFVGGDAKIFLPWGAWYPSYATGPHLHYT